MATVPPSFSRMVFLLALAACFVISGSAAAQTSAPSSTPSPGPATTTGAEDQVVLSGSVLVPRGQTVGEVVVFHGRAVVSGVVLGDVVVLDGPAAISGQVSGSVIALNGPIKVGGSASVRGDVMGSETVRVGAGASIGGDVKESVAFTPRGSLKVLGALLGPFAIAFSVLLLLLALLLLVPRGADRIATAARSAPLASLGWGVLLSILLPVVAVVASISVVGLPLGLAMLLALALLFLIGAAWSVWSLGRSLVREPRSRWLALLAGWGAALALSLVPYLNVAAWSLAAAFGLGAMTVAAWRARGNGGRHRAGYIALPEASSETETATEPEPTSETASEPQPEPATEAGSEPEPEPAQPPASAASES